MNILFNGNHPANYHLFKHAMRILTERGHKVLFTAIEKDVLRYLLERDTISHPIPYRFIGIDDIGILRKGMCTVKAEFNLLKIAREFQPDILIGGCGNLYVTHVGTLLRRPSVIFDTNEKAKLQHFLTDPFADAICTPSCYEIDLGKKHIRYNGYQELSYLHPNYFQPDSSTLESFGVSKSDNYVVLRFVAWNAMHDTKHRGISNKVELVHEIEDFAKVLISAEGDLPSELKKYSIKTEKMHDLLYHATLCVTEGATVASESALLGTHAVYGNTIKLGYLNELEKTYNLVFCCSDPENMDEEVRKRTMELLKTPNLKEIGKDKQKRLQHEKIDVTRFIVWFVENYPKSFELIQKTPGIQNELKL